MKLAPLPTGRVRVVTPRGETLVLTLPQVEQFLADLQHSSVGRDEPWDLQRLHDRDEP